MIYLPSTAAIVKITSLSKESCFSTVNRLQAYFAVIAIVKLLFLPWRNCNDNNKIQLELADSFVLFSKSGFHIDFMYEVDD